MKKLLVSLLLLSATGFLAGCTGETSGGNRDYSPVPPLPPSPAHSEEVKDSLLGNPSADYSILYSKVTGTCDFVSYQHYVYVRPYKIGKANDGKDILAELEVEVRANQTFEAKYAEIDVEKYTSTGYSSRRKRERFISGTWSLSKGLLILKDLAEMQLKSVGGETSLNVKYERNILSLGLSGKIARGSQVYSEQGLHSARERCPTYETSLGEFEPFAARESVLNTDLVSLASNEQTSFIADKAETNSVELFIHKDGNYDLVMTSQNYYDLSAPKKVILVESNLWERSAGSLKIVSGELGLLEDGKTAFLYFDKNVQYQENGQNYEIKTQGQVFRLTLGKSSMNIDDLTSGLKGGATFHR